MKRTQPHETEARIPARWLTPLRIVWVAIAILLFGIYFFGLVPHYNELHQICHTEECPVLTINPEELQTIEQFGLSMDAYALGQILLEAYLVAIFSGLAFLVFRLRSDTWVGYIISLAFLFLGLIFFAEEPRTLVRLYPNFMLYSDFLTSLSVGLLIMLLYLFPDGQFAPRGLRWAAAAMVIVLILDPFVNQSGQRATSGTMVIIIIFLIGALLGLYSQIFRYRKVSTPTQRQQTKWIVLGFLSMFVGMMTWAIFGEIAPLPPGVSRLIFYLSLVPQYVLIGIFPIALVISILRYRLWDIDLVIRRTLQYTILTGLLALVYFGSVVVLQGLFVGITGQSSQGIIILSTLVIAALFNPLRGRIQTFIDRRLYRQKYDAQQVLAQFARRLQNTTARDDVEIDQLTAELHRVVQETMQPETLILWLPDPKIKSS
ncbi:MAG: hypothetical protein KC449_20330 [Anaerolineales bacterium]|nr:hypothetical protein [Anaerolineales bacterium]